MVLPLDTHWKALKRILRYLSGALDFGIQICKSSGAISAFSDSDWAADLDDRRSTSGLCTYFGRNLISWCVKKQAVVARSSTEAEYRSLALAASEVSWLNSLLKELRIKQGAGSVIWVDNLSAIALASNPVLHARTKHIEIDMHFVRDKVLAKEIELRHVPTADQLADIFTKPLGRQSFEKLRRKLGMVSLASLGLRGRVEDDHMAETGNACKVKLHENEEMCKASLKNDELDICHVKDDIARDLIEADCLQSEDGTKDVVAGAKDHKRSWRDVLIQGAVKQCST